MQTSTLYLPPLAIYIHLPWCIQKCPYCDFNSHALRGEIDEKAYLAALFRDLENERHHVQNRSIISIFIGGGTPSLFSAGAIHEILSFIDKHFVLHDDIEITMEANPGTAEQARFRGYREAGINRLSLGIQSMQANKLNMLGRIHDAKEAHHAIEIAKAVGFNNFNLDLMFGLPEQNIDDALFDLSQALQHEPSHLSWYQLTIEPETFFYKQPPLLPKHDYIWRIQEAGQKFLLENGFIQYEISAYARHERFCQHNLNYWEFGDYIGIGAGAHGKITDIVKQSVIRYSKIKNPKNYSQLPHQIAEYFTVDQETLIFEFFMNAFRLRKKIDKKQFEQRTGIALCDPIIVKKIEKAVELNFLKAEHDFILVTMHGQNFLNELLEIFLP